MISKDFEIKLWLRPSGNALTFFKKTHTHILTKFGNIPALNVLRNYLYFLFTFETFKYLSEKKNEKLTVDFFGSMSLFVKFLFCLN